MTCQACNDRGKTWTGSDPVCWFDDAKGNWNCALVNQMRDIAESDHPVVDYRFCDDQKYATIQIDEIGLDSGPALALWISWYKSRGRTDAIWILSESGPRQPTEIDLIQIAQAAGREG